MPILQGETMNTHRRLCWLSYPLAHLVIWCVALQRFFILSEEACVPAYLAFLCMCSHKDMSSKQYAHKTGYYIYIYICIYIYTRSIHVFTYTHTCMQHDSCTYSLRGMRPLHHKLHVERQGIDDGLPVHARCKRSW